jgi:hypothetical protein
MSTWVPVINAHALDGFVIGALTSGACFLAITMPWRGRRRGAAVSLQLPDAVWPPAAPEPGGRDEQQDAGLALLAGAVDPAMADTDPAQALPAFVPQLEPGVAALQEQAPGPQPGPPLMTQPAPVPGRASAPAPGGRRRRRRGGGHRASSAAMNDPTLTGADGMPEPPGARPRPRHAAPASRRGGKAAGGLAAPSQPDSTRS